MGDEGVGGMVVTALLFAVLRSYVKYDSDRDSVRPVPIPRRRCVTSSVIVCRTGPHVFTRRGTFSTVGTRLSHVRDLKAAIL